MDGFGQKAIVLLVSLQSLYGKTVYRARGYLQRTHKDSHVGLGVGGVEKEKKPGRAAGLADI